MRSAHKSASWSICKMLRLFVVGMAVRWNFRNQPVLSRGSCFPRQEPVHVSRWRQQDCSSQFRESCRSLDGWVERLLLCHEPRLAYNWIQNEKKLKTIDIRYARIARLTPRIMEKRTRNQPNAVCSSSCIFAYRIEGNSLEVSDEDGNSSPRTAFFFIAFVNCTIFQEVIRTWYVKRY